MLTVGLLIIQLKQYAENILYQRFSIDCNISNNSRTILCKNLLTRKRKILFSKRIDI